MINRRVKTLDPRKLYKVGDLVEMDFGIKSQKIVKIVSSDRVEVAEPDSKSKRGVGVPLYWVKGKLKRKRLTLL